MSNSAMAVPRISSKVTEKAAKVKVCPNAAHHSWLGQGGDVVIQADEP
ncbi:hypothetical protein AAHB34_18155 [Paenarthrobacter ureafaciens]